MLNSFGMNLFEAVCKVVFVFFGAFVAGSVFKSDAAIVCGGGVVVVWVVEAKVEPVGVVVVVFVVTVAVDDSVGICVSVVCLTEIGIEIGIDAVYFMNSR